MLEIRLVIAFVFFAAAQVLLFVVVSTETSGDGLVPGNATDASDMGTLAPGVSTATVVAALARFNLTYFGGEASGDETASLIHSNSVGEIFLWEAFALVGAFIIVFSPLTNFTRAFFQGHVEPKPAKVASTTNTNNNNNNNAGVDDDENGVNDGAAMVAADDSSGSSSSSSSGLDEQQESLVEASSSLASLSSSSSLWVSEQEEANEDLQAQALAAAQKALEDHKAGGAATTTTTTTGGATTTTTTTSSTKTTKKGKNAMGRAAMDSDSYEYTMVDVDVAAVVTAESGLPVYKPSQDRYANEISFWLLLPTLYASLVTGQTITNAFVAGMNDGLFALIAAAVPAIGFLSVGRPPVCV